MRADGGERDLEDDQAGGVVDEAFALENGDDAARQAEPLRDGGSGDGVGRRDDGAEDETGRERKMPCTALGMIQCATKATVTVVAMTRPMASSRIGRR